MFPAGEAELTGWDFACPDWKERLKSGRSLIPDLPLDQAKADRAVSAFNKLRLPDVRFQPPMADAAGEWFRDIVRAIFGSLDNAGKRHVPEVFCEVPKKNSKTTYSAALMLTALLMNDRPNAEMIYAGPTQKISDRAFNQTKGMINADPEGFLVKRFHVVDNQKKIVDRWSNTTLQVKTFDTAIVTGSAPVAVLIDEIHLLSKISGAADVISQLRWGMLANPDAFMMMITTQSFDQPAGVFKTELEYARDIRDGKVTDAVRMLPVLYEFPEEMQQDKKKPWADPKNWPMVHPNLGRSITVDGLLASFKESKAKGESELRRWASQNLNIQIGVAMHADQWTGAKYWEAAADPTLDLVSLLDRCEVCVIGIDGGGADDLLGLCVAGRETGTKRWLYWCHAWVDRALLKLRPEIAGALDGFEKDGDLTFCDFTRAEGTENAATPDIDGVVAIVRQVKESGKLAGANAVGLDPQGVGAIVDALADIGVDGDLVHAVSQGYRLASAIWSLERKLRDGTAIHGGQEMMNWCVGNAKAVQAGNAVLVTKAAAGKAKIDPLCATFDATKLLELNPGSRRSVYEEHGIRRV